jgi:hypothetical protein
MGTYRPVTPEEQLRALAAGHVGVLETLARMQLGALERSKLDEERYLLVRLAALVATDATPVSYRAHLGGAGDLSTAKVVGTLAAIAPMIGSAGAGGRLEPGGGGTSPARPARSPALHPKRVMPGTAAGSRVGR